MALFYTPDPYFLSVEETNHAKNVLRIKEFDNINAIDGKGNFYVSQIQNFSKNGTKLNVISTNKEAAPSHYIHVAIAPTKNADRTEWFVEKAIEIGVNEISFIQCQRSERKNIQFERIQKLAVSAIKQSQKATLPIINDIQKFQSFLNDLKNYSSKYIAHLEEIDKKYLTEEIKNIIGNRHLILIGPEGDFTDVEIESASKNGFFSVSLGNSRLRTETAALYAVTHFSILNL